MVYYFGANLEWFGRQLQTYEKGNLDISYTYDADGLRTSKTVDGATTTYQYVGDKLYYLCAKDATGADDYEMYFFYDSYDKLTVLKYFKHKGENPGEYTYYAATNYFGDVVGLYDGEGNILNSYEYDAWGNVIGVYKHEHSTDDEGKPVISTVENTDLNSIAHRNPIRYRSYCYDTETGLYYLQSRYYNPEIGRFLNADGYVTTGQGLLSYNMFAYCLNNPILLYDYNGCAGRLSGLFRCLIRKTISFIPLKESKSNFFEDLLNRLTSTKDNGNTCSFGLSYGYSSGGVSKSKSKVLSSDSSYNYALQETISTGASTGVGGSLAFSYSFTNASNVNDLNGESKSWGGTISNAMGLSLEVTKFSPASNPDKICYGFGFSICVGGEVEVHSAYNNTVTEKKWQPLVSLKEKLYG